MEIETALNVEANIKGSTVIASVNAIASDSKFGFNVQAGEQLNFIINETSDILKKEVIINLK